MSKVNITDVILRDAHQSLIATRMRTEDMLPVCDKLDAIGYWSLECWGGATYDACLRFLKEDPWERLRKLREALPNTRLQMLLRGQNLLGYRHYADDVVRAFVLKAAENGMDVFRIFDALNDLRNLRTAVEATVEAGKHAQGTICYTISPVHSIDDFVTQARELQAMGCHSICIKDMAGLLTPYTTGELVQALTDAVDLPLHLHSHSTAGLADMCHLKAIENGCRHIDTAISSFAGGTSHPPTESLVAARMAIHRREELPLYVASLKEIRGMLADNLTPKELEIIKERIPALYRRTMRDSIPGIVTMLTEIDDTQIDHLQTRFDERNRKFEENFMAKSMEVRLDRRVERSMAIFEFFIGELRPEQVVLVTRHRNAMPLTADDWLA
ncbi:MAG: DUF6279 family lipoprotein, partial [Pseudomonadota bacterium]|nr:DUF6279 family lipoprotein [Pseudomonadota bacterium]